MLSIAALREGIYLAKNCETCVSELHFLDEINNEWSFTHHHYETWNVADACLNHFNT